MSDDARDEPIVSTQHNASKDKDGRVAADRPARLRSTPRTRGGSGLAGNARQGQPEPSVDVVLERRGRGYAVQLGERMKPAGDDGDSFYRAVLLGLGQTRGDEVASHDIQALRNDVADTLMPRLNSGLLRIWWQNRRKRTGLSPERYIERYIRSPGSWDEPLAQLLPVIVPSCATWRGLGGNRLMVDAPGYGRHADKGKPRPAPAVRASELWDTFVKGGASTLPPMDPQVLRDRPLPISMLSRQAHITLDHPRDAVEMRMVPSDLSITFPTLAGPGAQDDQRNLVLLPSATTLVNMHGSLPTIEVGHAIDDSTATVTYTVSDTGNGALARFVFAAHVACPAMHVLEVLKRAADGKQAVARQALQALMTDDLALIDRASAQRAAMARLWSDLSDEVRRRVLAGFAARDGLKALELDVTRELKSGAEPARVALATDMLVAALDLWQVRCDIARIPFSFWLGELAHEMPSTAGWREFILARSRVLASFSRWQAARADLVGWLDAPAAHGNLALASATRECLSAALARADDAKAQVPAQLRGLTAREVRTRLLDARDDIVRQRGPVHADAPAVVVATLSRCAVGICGGDGEMADDAGAGTAAVPPVSHAWSSMLADNTREVLRLDGRAARDSPLDLSQVKRRATLLLDHPGDIVQMREIPADLSVRFDPVAPGSVGSDQRWLLIVPGQSELLGQYGTLPSIEVTLSAGAQPGWQVYTLFDIGLRVGCHFTLAGAVAPRVERVLESLKQAADDKWSAFRSLYATAMVTPQVQRWDASLRASAAAYWRAFPDLVKKRVLDYYQLWSPSQALLRNLDIARTLGSGTDADAMALARQVLVSAMDYWDEHGEADDIAASFWDDASRQDLPAQASTEGFADMLERTLQAHRQWQQTAPPFDAVLQWLSQPVLEGDAIYTPMRRCLRRAMRRATGAALNAGEEVQDSLADATAAQVRARLARVGQALAADSSSATPSRMAPALQIWMATIGGAEPILLAAGARVDAAAIQARCVPAGMGVRAVRYVLDADLPATEVAAVFAIDTALLADGSLPLEKLGQADGGSGDDARWWRSYRLSGPWTHDATARSWQRAQYEVIVEGTVAAQRQAFDAHMDSRARDMASAQSFLLYSNDRQQITVSGNASELLTPHSRFDQRTVQMVADGGLLLLPAGLRGTITINLSRLDQDAAAAIEVAPQLLATLEEKTAASVDGKTFMCYGREGDDALVLRIGPQESAHPLCRSLAGKLRQFARRQLVADLANEAKVIILVSPVLDEEIVLPPMRRDVLIYPLARNQKFTIRQIGPARLQLLSSVPLDATTADLCLNIELPDELLPRYGVSDMVLGYAGYLTGAIQDNRNGGKLLVGCTPGVKLDRARWRTGVDRLTKVHDTYIDHLFDWDHRLARGTAFVAADLETIQGYSRELVEHLDETMLYRAALLSGAAQAQHEAALAGTEAERAGDISAGERRSVSAVVAQMLLFSFSRVFGGVSEKQWREMIAAHDSSSISARFLGMYVDMAWQREQADEFYSGLAGLYRFLQMSTTDTTREAALERDEACIDAALDLVAGKPVDDDTLRRAGLEHAIGSRESMLRLKLTMVTRHDEKLFDDDAFWRDLLLRDLRRTHGRSRRNSLLDLLASILAGRGGRDAALLAYQHQKGVAVVAHPPSFEQGIKRDIVIFETLSTMQAELAVPSGGTHRLSRSIKEQPEPVSCKLVSAVNFTGALLIFIGDVGTVLGKWYINEPTSPKQRFATMYFQVVKAAGWAAQQAAGFACQPETEGPVRFIQLTSPVVGLGMSFNYLAGGLSELVVRPPRTRWTWRRDMRPLIARMPGARAHKIMQLIDLAGNVYLIMAEAAKIAALSQQAEKPSGIDVLSATAACSSAVLGTIAAGGEIGIKTLLTPARQFYQAVGLSSAILNLCSAAGGVSAGGPLRGDADHHEL